MALLFWPTLLAAVLAAFYLGRQRAAQVAGGSLSVLHSLPVYHGLLAAAVAFVPMLLVFVIGSAIVSQTSISSALSQLPVEISGNDLQRGAALRDIVNITGGQYQGTAPEELRRAAESYGSVRSIGGWLTFLLAIGAGIGAVAFLLSRVHPEFRARNRFERITKVALLVCAGIAVLTTIGIVFSVAFETYRFFFDPALRGRPTVTEFLFGTQWSPQGALRADQAGQSSFGFVPLLTGTLLITIIAMCVAGPIGLFAAIFMSEYATPRMRAFAKPILEILAGVPTVVLGFFAALTLAPFIRGLGETLGLDVASESALAAGLIMGMMIIPFVSSLSDDVINAVPQSLRDGSYGLGATKAETTVRVLLPAALPGIVASVILAFSKALGETMIVVMAAGLAANTTLNPFEAVTTVTVYIAALLTGEAEFDSPKTLASFALGLVLFIVTLALNIVALRIVKAYREQYE